MKILNLIQNTLIVLVVAVLLFVGCASPNKITVSDTPLAFDVDWSQTDAHVQLRLLSETISTAEWLMLYSEQNRGKRPVLLIAPIRNNTGYRVDCNKLRVDFERLLQNRSTTTVITGLSNPDTSKTRPLLTISELLSLGRSHGATYIILSDLTASTASGIANDTNYLFNVELLDLRTQTSIWKGVSTIRQNEILSK